MRPFRLVRYALVAVLFLGIAAVAVVANRETPSAVGFFAALALAALAAALTRREWLSRIVRLGLLAAVADFVVFLFLAVHGGWNDSASTAPDCGPSASYVGSTVALYAFIGATAAILVLSCLPPGRLRRRPSNE
jgi:hypothetical protein